jgi:hypothetical protein
VLADRLFEWAVVRSGDRVTVRYRPNESWVELVRVPGIGSPAECGSELADAWVARSSVHFPDGK